AHRHVLHVQRHGVDGLALVLHHQEDPQRDREDQGEELELPVLEDTRRDRDHALPRTVSRRTPSSSPLRDTAGGVPLLLSSALRPSTSRAPTPDCIPPSTAIEMPPVSSETTTTTASVSSARPRAARWRVPSVRASRRLRDSGRKQPATLMRPPWTKTAPSWSGEVGRKTLPSSSADTVASTRIPSSA